MTQVASTGIPTSSWRDPLGAGQPENELFGIQYIGVNETSNFPLRVYADKVSDPLFRNTGLEKIPAGTFIEIGKSLVGWEWDTFVENATTPKGVTILFDSPVFGEILQDAGSKYLLDNARAQTTYYEAPSGSFVFDSGTNQWSWGLDLYEPDIRIQQITYNVFVRMGVSPATPGPDLVVNGINDILKSSPEDLVPKDSSNPPEIKNIAVDNSQQNIITVQWETDKPSTSQVWYWKENSKGYFDSQSVWVVPSTLSITDLDQAHLINLVNLTPEAVYHFEIVSQDEQGNTALSSPKSFTVPQASFSQLVITGFQPIKSGIICGVKPFVMPAFTWLKQIDGWVVSGFVSLIFLLLGILVLYRRTTI